MILEASRHSLHLQGFEPDLMREVLSHTEVEHVLLSSGLCDAEHQRWVCDGLTIDTGRYSFPVRIFGEFPAGRVCIGYMREITCPTWVNGLHADLDTLEFYAKGSEINYRAGRDGRWVALGLAEERLQQLALQKLGRALELPRCDAMSFQVPGDLRRDLDRRVRRLMVRRQVESSVLESFIGMVVELLDHLARHDVATLIQASQRRYFLIKRADAFLRASIGRRFDSRKLAAAVGVSERSLERCFVEAYGLTPQRWARCLALHHVRENLRRANYQQLTVEGLARDAGFHHMGRFSQYYSDLFGELPSLTLEKRYQGRLGISSTINWRREITMSDFG